MIGKKIAAGLEIPPEAVVSLPLVTIRGKDEAVVENYKRLVSFGEEEVVILTKYGRLKVMGEKLSLEYMVKDSIKITGRINKVGYE